MIKKEKAELSTGVFYITYKCNDGCDFCFAKESLGKIEDMNFVEIKKNYLYIRKKYKIKQVIISGGEPTLHPDFWKIMYFFYNQTREVVSLNTNAILFADQSFKKKMLSFMQKAKNERKTFSLSFSSVNDIENKKGSLRWKKIRGVENALEVAFLSHTKTFVVVSITKHNYKILSELGKIIYNKKRKFQSKNPKLIVNLRGLYLGHYMSTEQKKRNLPESFEKIKPFVQQFLENFIFDRKVQIGLFNLPLCYFKDWSKFRILLKRVNPFFEYTKKVLREERMKVDKISQMKKIKPALFQEDSWENDRCKKCEYIKFCNKIHPEFIENFGYPKLKSFENKDILKNIELIVTNRRNIFDEKKSKKNEKFLEDDLSWEEFVDKVNNCVEKNIRSIILSGGEPSLWPYINKAIDLLNSIGFMVYLKTDCHRMVKSLPYGVVINGNSLLEEKNDSRALKNFYKYRRKKTFVKLVYEIKRNDTKKTLKSYYKFSIENADQVVCKPFIGQKLDRKMGKVVFSFVKIMIENGAKIQISREFSKGIFNEEENIFIKKYSEISNIKA